MESPDPTVLSVVENQQYARELRETLPEEAASMSIRNVAARRTQHEAWEKRFGEVVRRWRQDRNWSQEEVAERLRPEGFEMHQTTVAKIERGSRPLRVAEAAAIATVFGMPVSSVWELSLKADAPWWSMDVLPTELRNRYSRLETARSQSDRARDRMYSAAREHAYFLSEIEKVVLAMNAEAATSEAHDDPEA